MLPGWNPAKGPHHADAPPQPAEAPPPEPKMTPEAREALLIMEMEKTASLRTSPGAKAGRKAGGFMMMLAVGNIAGAVMMKALGMTSSTSGIIQGAIDAIVLGPLAVGTYMGKQKWGYWGIGYFALSTIVSLLLPGGEAAGTEIDMRTIAAASTVGMNGIVLISLYWFVKKMDK